jgi:hypothetical protein
MLVVDHFGRQRLMFVGLLGYLLSLATIGWAFHAYADRFNAAIEAEQMAGTAQEAVSLTPTDLAAIETLAAAQTAPEQANESMGFGGPANALIKPAVHSSHTPCIGREVAGHLP